MAFLRLSETVVFAIGVQDAAPLREPVQGGSRQTLVPENFGQILDLQIGYDDDAVPITSNNNYDIAYPAMSDDADRWLVKLGT